MNKDAFNPDQRVCVETLDAPLFVAAGAGSGKTFTLTQRIAWALLDGSGPDGGPFASSIDEIMAITFTDKAASEIKARVKSTLRAEGLAEESLKVDSAWISTIHGACARILREHALELGIDPDFQMASDGFVADALAQAVEEVLIGHEEGSADGSVDALFAAYPPRSTGHGGTSVEDMLMDIAQAAAESPAGMDSVVDAGAGPAPVVLAQQALDLARTIAPSLAGLNDSSSKREFEAALHGCEQKLDELLSSWSEGADERFLGILGAFPMPKRTFGKGDNPYAAHVGEWAQELAEICLNALQASARIHFATLRGLASDVLAAFERIKREACVLDNTDLVTKAHRALEDHPAIAREYAHAFRLVMIDEFQDTDQMGIDMVMRLSGGGARLCTVGDAQQSIYRFRGADVGVFRAHEARMRALGDAAMVRTLDTNYRSNADVLAFVDCLFSGRAMFGASFMSLRPGRDESRIDAPYRGSAPRIQVVLVQRSKPPKGSSIDSSCKTAVAADAIARRFERLRAEGHRARDMVVLLGRMTNADAFARALRGRGFECVIAGGSLFGEAPETRAVMSLVRAIANPNDETALLDTLESDLFAVGDDDILSLVTECREDGSIAWRALARGFWDLLYREPTVGISQGLAHAASVLDACCRMARTSTVEDTLLHALAASGWLARLESQGAEGIARAGNALKAVRFAAGLAAELGCGIAGVASAMPDRIVRAKEAPGALSAGEGDFVRIMTIHSSKGLEFPIVAVAEIGKGKEPTNEAFLSTRIKGVTYATLLPRSAFLPKELKKKADAFVLPEDVRADVDRLVASSESPASRRRAIVAYETEQGRQEAQRLMYVALTRASEALVLVMDVDDNAAHDIRAYAPLDGAIRNSIMGFGGDSLADFPSGASTLPYGGSEDAAFERIVIGVNDEGGVIVTGGDGEACRWGDADADEGEKRVFAIPEAMPSRMPSVPFGPEREGFESYTSLSSLAGALDANKGGASATAREGVPSFDEASEAGIDPFADDAEEGAFGRAGAAFALDEDRATDVGAAFHALAQWSVEEFGSKLSSCRCDASRREGLPLPPPDRIAATAQAFGVSSSAAPRLEAACLRWTGSACAREAIAWPNLHAEYPFFIPMGASSDGSEEWVLEGSMDLFSGEEDGSCARIVDYKTGGRFDDAPDDILERHRLQATCYAFAALSSGYDRVEATFVYVEQPDWHRDREPRCVVYSFDAADLDGMRDLLEAIHARRVCP